MTHRTRHVRAGTTIIRVAAAALLLAGCGDRLLESREAELELAEPLQGARVADPRMHLRRPEGTPLAINKVLRAPMVVGDAVDHAQAPIPVMSLVRVEVALYRPIDCDKPPAWLLDSRAFDYPASVDEARLADLGLPVHAAEVWLVPASTGGVYSDARPRGAAGNAVAMERRYSGEESEQRAPFDAAFEFGPAWLGIPLRQVGAARTVVFPPSQDCTGLKRAQDDRVPIRVVAYGPFDQGSEPSKYLRVPADTPFTARVVEVCPVRIKQRDELFEVRTGMIYRPASKEWRFAASVLGECESGVVELKLGPLVTRVTGGDAGRR